MDSLLLCGHRPFTANCSATEHWGFAIYKYGDTRNDADEWLFPGSQHLDGTIAGAMRAGLEAYPP